MYWQRQDDPFSGPDKASAILVSEESPEQNVARVGNSPVTPPPLEERADYTPEELHTIRLFERAAPSVCFITTSVARRDYYTRDITEIPAGSGSGFVWDKQGHVITNFHVVQKASSVLVTLADGAAYRAEIIGVAPEKDLAVLKIDASRTELVPIPVGTSENLRVGQSVYAIGNPFGLDQTLTTGVVSALGREIQSVAGIPIRGAVQTDAAINPGNSGGPLLDSNGRLIGVNTQIYSPSGASAGIGFSIPVDVVRWVVPELIAYGRVQRPSLGIEITRPLRGVEGAAIAMVEQGSAADRSGLQGIYRDQSGNVRLGDVITAINGVPITSGNDLILELEKYDPGDNIRITVQRNERKVEVSATLDPARN
jgi:S1-C subfamily serine protease